MKAHTVKQDIELTESKTVFSKFSFSILELERKSVEWMSRYRIVCLQVSLGMIFIVFGGLKFFPGCSPAESLAGDTLRIMTLGLLQPALSLPILAIGECLLGIGLMAGVAGQREQGVMHKGRRLILRLTLPALFLHMIGTATPLFLMPECVFGAHDGGPLLTMECQYILKNLVLISAAIAVGGQQTRALAQEEGE